MLSVEEKAKAYDEAIERARLYKGLQAEMEIIFPELKENEDERIRKALIDGFKRYDDGALFNRCLIRDIIAYLEKQGEQKSDTDFSDLKTWEFILENFKSRYGHYPVNVDEIDAVIYGLLKI